MTVPEYIVNLDLPPEERWQFLRPFKSEMNELFKFYLKDLAGIEFIYELIPTYRDSFISEEYSKEMATIADITGYSTEEILVANLYYDILKSYFGCTAFAVDNGEQLFHARNLDWHTENNMLSKYTSIFDFQKSEITLFKSVGWKGFIGVLSGMNPSKFSITLNAILSDDPSEIAYPVSLYIRDVLTKAESYSEAKKMLETKNIASDCLLLLSGISKNEFSVIERTPTRYATRNSLNKHIIVTNDYRILEDSGAKSESILSQTSCGRFDRTNQLLKEENLQSMKDCLQILKDEKVQMGITVQQMIFDNRSGRILVDNMRYLSKKIQ